MTYEQESQARYRCNVEWGRQGVRQAVERQDALVIVDTLRFSTATVAAVYHGAAIYPALDEADAEEVAHHVDGVVAGHSGGQSTFSLSPESYSHVEIGVAVVLPSHNGAVCSRDGADAPYVFVGTLVNAQAVAGAVSSVLERTNIGVTVVACGEYRSQAAEGGVLRFAIEDYLAAGAILSGLPESKSPEAHLCEMAFEHARTDLQRLIWDSVSAWELREKGLADDVVSSSQLDMYDTVPVMHGNKFKKLSESLLTSSGQKNNAE